MSELILLTVKPNTQTQSDSVLSLASTQIDVASCFNFI